MRRYNRRKRRYNRYNNNNNDYNSWITARMTNTEDEPPKSIVNEPQQISGTSRDALIEEELKLLIDEHRKNRILNEYRQQKYIIKLCITPLIGCIDDFTNQF
jgi:hypothetical protein